MIGIDTNVLIRLLVEDPEALDQNRAARALASRAQQVFVPLLVVVESVWVLETAYGLSRERVDNVLTLLGNNNACVIQDRDLFDQALAHYRSGIDFADGVILEVNRARDLTLYTFDRRFARLEGVERLGNQPTGD